MPIKWLRRASVIAQRHPPLTPFGPIVASFTVATSKFCAGAADCARPCRGIDRTPAMYGNDPASHDRCPKHRNSRILHIVESLLFCCQGKSEIPIHMSKTIVLLKPRPKTDSVSRATRAFVTCPRGRWRDKPPHSGNVIISDPSKCASGGRTVPPGYLISL